MMFYRNSRADSSTARYPFSFHTFFPSTFPIVSRSVFGRFSSYPAYAGLRELWSLSKVPSLFQHPFHYSIVIRNCLRDKIDSSIDRIWIASSSCSPFRLHARYVINYAEKTYSTLTESDFRRPKDGSSCRHSTFFPATSILHFYFYDIADRRNDVFVYFLTVRFFFSFFKLSSVLPIDYDCIRS